MRSKAIRYVVIFLVAPHLCLIATALLFGAFQKQLPAPHLSNSVSFNEKARWLKDHFEGSCDVLIIGSSMALNNVDSKKLEALFPREVIINTASWGMSIEESDLMLKKIVRLCKPKTIILVTNYLDFATTEKKEIAWDRFERYLKGSHLDSMYMRGFDLIYLADDIKFQSAVTGERRSYESLAFDGTGTVNLDCQQFKIDPRRWDGYKFDHLPPSRIRPESVNAIGSIAETANQLNSHLVVITTPMRQVAEESFYPEVRNELWGNVKRRVENMNGIYIHIAGTAGFDDGLFADFLHLNECGAKKLTDMTTHILQRTSWASSQ